MRLLFAALISIVCAGAVYLADRATALRAERHGYPTGYHPLTINHRRPPAWQWAAGLAILFVIALGALAAAGLSG